MADIYAELKQNGEYKVVIPYDYEKIHFLKILSKLIRKIAGTHAIPLEKIKIYESELKKEIENILRKLAIENNKNLLIFKHDLTAVYYDFDNKKLVIFGKIEYKLEDL